MKKIQLTRQGFDKLNTELNELKTMKRPLTVDRLQKARSMGDLKENSGYQRKRRITRCFNGRFYSFRT